jgi:hypothetical protein
MPLEGGGKSEFRLIEFEEYTRLRLRRLGGEVCVGRWKACLLASSIDVYLGCVLPSADPVVLSNGLPDVDPTDPVNNDGGGGKASLAAVCGAGGLVGGDEASGSRVTLPVSKLIPGRLFWLVALPDVFGRGLVVRRRSDC